jgi:hypothetical protein
VWTNHFANDSKVPTEEFSLYHIDGVTSKSTTIKALNGPTVVIITNVNSSAGGITQTINGNRTTVGDVKVGQVFLIGAGTQVEFSHGLEVWGSFWDDQEQEQTGNAWVGTARMAWEGTRRDWHQQLYQIEEHGGKRDDVWSKA